MGFCYGAGCLIPRGDNNYGAYCKRIKILYKDGQTQELEAQKTDTTKEFIYFLDDGNEVILQVAADLVESVGNADIPAPSHPKRTPGV